MLKNIYKIIPIRYFYLHLWASMLVDLVKITAKHYVNGHCTSVTSKSTEIGVHQELRKPHFHFNIGLIRLLPC